MGGGAGERREYVYSSYLERPAAQPELLTPATNVAAWHAAGAADALSTDGDDLVPWMSIEVVRDKARTAQPWEGALFIHGMYFAHNPEPDAGSKIGALIAAAGLRQPLLKPPPKRTWRRLAR